MDGFPNFAIICIEPAFCVLPVAQNIKNSYKRDLKNHYYMSKRQHHFFQTLFSSLYPMYNAKNQFVSQLAQELQILIQQC